MTVINLFLNLRCAYHLRFTHAPITRVHRIYNERRTDQMQEFIEKLKKSKNFIVMSGAGISTNAGIPDFRSHNRGLYNDLKNYNQLNPTEILTFSFFQKEPKKFYEFARKFYQCVDKARPTTTHYFIKLLHDKGVLLRHFTQNVDGLHLLTNLPKDKVVEAHGHIRNGSCIVCKSVYTFEFMKYYVFRYESPKCEKCSGLIRPNIVFFDEGVTYDIKQNSPEFEKCDLLIILGTSLHRNKFSKSVNFVNDECLRLRINRDEVYKPIKINTWFSDPLFDKNSNKSCNVFFQSDVDAGCMKLAEFLGWKEDFLAILEKKMYDERKKNNFN